MITPDLKPCILVVEDERDLREIIVHFLKSEFDIEILEADNGLHAKVILEKMPQIRIVVSDYIMPMMNGGNLFQHMKNTNHAAKFILISAMEPLEAPEFQNVLPDGYAEKPNFYSTLHRQVKSFLVQ